MIKKDNLNKDNIHEAFAELIKTEGTPEGEGFYIFDAWYYSSEYGVELSNSTIDNLYLYPNGRIEVIYNRNTHDSDDIRSFKDEDLISYYNDLVEAINEEALENEVDDLGEW